jgi:3-methyladenine DNA glycosylase AlkC
MADTLKQFFSPALVRRLAGEIERVHPRFPVDTFVAQATRGLGKLELVARGRHIASALANALPPAYPDAIAVLLRSLGPPHASDELIGAGLAPFFYLPHLTFVSEHGLVDFELSMHALYELTKRFTAEGAIRTFIAHDPERTFAVLEAWTRDRDPHVRRLVSEGTRLRLPWAMRVAWLDEHPERVVALLELLKDDPATLVRRSVANNLNDLGKVHPELLVRTCEAWLCNARRELVEHALRSAVKRSLPGALKLLGYGGKPRLVIEDVACDPPRVAIGGKVTIAFALRSTATTNQHLLVDLAVHFVKVRGTSPKVFKLERVTLAPKQRVELGATVSLAVHTTRVPRPGTHAVDVLINGHATPIGAFEVTRARASRR